jgi:hypothetical protein
MYVKRRILTDFVLRLKEMMCATMRSDFEIFSKIPVQSTVLCSQVTQYNPIAPQWIKLTSKLSYMVTKKSTWFSYAHVVPGKTVGARLFLAALGSQHDCSLQSILLALHSVHHLPKWGVGLIIVVSQHLQGVHRDYSPTGTTLRKVITPPSSGTLSRVTFRPKPVHRYSKPRVPGPTEADEQDRRERHVRPRSWRLV